MPIDGHEPVIGQLIVAQRTGPQFFAFAARVRNDVALGVPVGATPLPVDVDSVDQSRSFSTGSARFSTASRAPAAVRASTAKLAI